MELQRTKGRRLQRRAVTIQEPGIDEIVDQDYVFDFGSINEEAAEVLVPIIAEVIHVYLTRDELATKATKAKSKEEAEKLAEELSKEFGKLVLEKINDVLPKVPETLYRLVGACSTVYRSEVTPYEWGVKLEKIDDEPYKQELISSLDCGNLLDFAMQIFELTDVEALMANFRKLLVRAMPQKESDGEPSEK